MSLAKDMKAKGDDDLVTRFLLEELSEKERLEVEERFLSDNQFFEEMLAGENALIDQYLLGLLDDKKRERAKVLIESGREQQLNAEFTRELIALVRASGLPEGKNPSLEVPISAGWLNKVSNVRTAAWLGLVLVVIILASWIVYLHFKERNLEARRLAAEQSNQQTTDKLKQEIARSENLAQELQSERQEKQRMEELLTQSQSSHPAVVTSILLTPANLARGGVSKVVSLKVKPDRIRLQLALDEDARYERYSLLITTFEDRKIWSSDSIKANQIRRGNLEVTLAGSLFGYEDYKLVLKGLSATGDFVYIADYVFKVRK